MVAELWELSGRLCGKLLVAVLPRPRRRWSVPRADLDAGPARRLLSISAATLDRLRRPVRQPARAAAAQRGGAALKTHILYPGE